MVGSLLLLTLFFSSPALSAECSETALIRQFEEIEKKAGVRGNREELKIFYDTIAKCEITREQLFLSTRLEKLENQYEVAETREKIAALLYYPRKDGWKKIDELFAFGKSRGMKKKEFDEARARWRNLYFAAVEKSREQTKTRCQVPKNQSARFPPAHEQGKLGWCYAYVAADLLSFETGKPVAPLAIGLGYFRKNNYEKFITSDTAAKEKILNSAGGHILEAINIAKDEGICPARQDVATGDLFDRVLSLLDQTKIPDILGSQEKFCDAYASATLTVFPGVSTSEFERILRKAGVQGIIQEMRKASCQKKTRLPKNLKVENDFYPNLKNTESLETIQNALLRNSVAGVSVNMNVVLKKPVEPAHHAMIVMGQKWNPEIGQCEFLLRNSWGKQCDNFNAEMVSCDPDTGSLRVRADVLSEITYGTTTLSR